MSDKKAKKEEEKKPDAAVEGAEGAEGAEPKKSKKKLIIIAVAGLVVLGGGGTAAMMLMGGEKKPAEHGKEEKAGHGKKEEVQLDEHGKPIPNKPLFFSVPDIIVNLNSPSPRPHFVNLKLTLEVSNAANLVEVENQLPRIVDSFNTYLREVRREDLQGSAGLYRLERELQLRLNKILGEGVVNDILFKEIIVQ